MQLEKDTEQIPAKADRVFRVLYRTNAYLILLVALVLLVAGVWRQDIDGYELVPALLFGGLFVITPLAIPFLVLNLWGAYRYERWRTVRLLATIPLVLWLVYAVGGLVYPLFHSFGP